jgi:hypothetical protein
MMKNISHKKHPFQPTDDCKWIRLTIVMMPAFLLSTTLSAQKEILIEGRVLDNQNR